MTGGTGGIGLAVVERLLDDGWNVLAGDVADPPRPNSPRPGLESTQLDVADPEAVRRVATRLAEEERGVAGLVNVAGLLQDVTALDAVDPALVERIWSVNYLGAHRCMVEFARLMRGGGSIVNITSINAHRPLPLHAYAPVKAALDAATRLAAGELGRRGIRVNAVAPGFTLTPALAAKIKVGARDATSMESAAALQRLVDPAEVAAVVAFLMSDDASAVTGTSIPVDAGWLATSHWMDFGDRLDGGS
ncbi:SDR family NAD(P)-dependent oxidoreductase [Nocardioides sp. L-11A]|uniref:SDR family NAD(P)-dependent oxidoreductase n=1 Tax=Nocardioides sp. L-11A TaxID=3043848 RepID=UPI00249B6935|nr:SDR family oxidoreductase [Nocardioides sp. L-11A]